MADMLQARRRVELTVRLGNEPGALGRVLAVLGGHAINLLAYCTYTEPQGGVGLLVSEKPLKAKAALTAAGYRCRSNSVILASAADQVGSVAVIGTRLGLAGVNILYSYASSTGADQFYAVFKTNDDQRALTVLNARTAAPLERRQP